ncbi:putative multi-pass transmembrane protein [Leptomonas seymouri]|uniref:Putative multi-pass transmembrane protein n=1 Tax=Leptomonas seymouri TaxID=5684 RepID=A0A0N1PBI7_LEPSE|nr:putative multi-pass transmembrane protein [Leptomonas seymouri]|eukprot:KPI86435.1 putative multi-pass transmembrane protein [Leptomonas seymouri]
MSPCSVADIASSESSLKCVETATAVGPPTWREGAAHEAPRPPQLPYVTPEATPTAHSPRALRTQRSACGERKVVLRHSAAVSTASPNAQYLQNWSQVVLGATSGIMFVLVVCLSYALYVLVTPYYYSITSGVLLSIVMHPQNRLRSALFVDTAVGRMRQVQRQWAMRGRLAGVVGSWLSLLPFASAVVMHITFFLGLNKIRVAANSVLLGSNGGTACRTGSDGVHGMASSTQATAMEEQEETESAAESRADSPRPYAFRGGMHTAHWKAATGALRASSKRTEPAAATMSGADSRGADSISRSADVSSSSHPQTPHFPVEAQRTLPSLDASMVLSSATAMPPSTSTAKPGHVRLVATARGRRVLRYLTIVTLAIFAHLFVGIVYFVLLHLALGAVFALVVPLMSAEKFVSSMGRLWRVAIALFFMVGLTVNLTADVLSISQAVRRTTSAVVRSGGGGLTGIETQGVSHHEINDNASGSLSRYAQSAAGIPTSTASSMVEGEDESDVDAFALLRQHRGKLESLIVSQVQTLVVQELADMFSNGNVSEMLRTLTRVLPPQLQSVVLQDVVESSDRGGLAHTAAKRGSEVSSVGSVPGSALFTSSSSATRSSTSLTFTWANIRALSSISSLKSLVYASLSNTSGANTTGGANCRSNKRAARTSSKDSAAAGEGPMPIDWITVFRLLASRLLPYVEHALRLLIRLASNLMELFDGIYAVILFVFFYRYLTQLEHTVLYYGIAKVLRVIQPEVGDFHARSIEHDITVSFITLLQSFWHLTWFHFCVTFSAFKMWDLPTPFLLGLASVVLALFPLVPKWLSPCSIAFVSMVVQLISLTTSEEEEGSPFLVIPDGHTWTEALIFGKPYLYAYARTLSFGVAMLLECGDEWLLCVSRGLRGGFVTDAAGKGREQLQPFVVGTSVVLGFVAYGIRGIVFGPLTVIVARVLFDNWDIVLPVHDNRTPPPSTPPLPSPISLSAEEGDGFKRRTKEKGGLRSFP